MDASSIIETLTPLCRGAATRPGPSVDFATIYVPAAALVETCRALRDMPSLRFNVLVEVTAADYLPREPRFEVVYHLLSIPNRQRLPHESARRVERRSTASCRPCRASGRRPGWPSAKCGTCSGSCSAAIATCAGC